MADENEDNGINLEDAARRIKIMFDDELEYVEPGQAEPDADSVADTRAEENTDKYWAALDTDYDGLVTKEDSDAL